ncbi:MAG: L,D-transpeptidase family protein, partial [Gammaproteobacteria bacterium]
MADSVKFCINAGMILNIRFGNCTSRLILLLLISFSRPLLAEETVDRQSLLAKEIMTIISSKQHPDLLLPDFSSRYSDLDSLYKLSDYGLLWLGHADSDKNIAEVLNLLANASSQGLNPGNYDIEALKGRIPEILGSKPNSVKKMARYDTALSLSLLRFLHDLHYGRVNPQGINFNLKLRERKLTDLPVLIKGSLNQGTIAQLPDIV